MSDASIKRELELLGQNFNEILSSTAAVKGEAFANAVAINFECAQLIEAIGGLVIIVRKVDAERAEGLYEIFKCVLASIASKGCDTLEDGQLEEAVLLSKTLYERRRDTVNRIRLEARDGD